MSKVFRVSAVKVLLVVLNRLPFKTPCQWPRLVLLERLLYDEDRSVGLEVSPAFSHGAASMGLALPSRSPWRARTRLNC